MGDEQVNTLLIRLKDSTGVDAKLVPVRIPYRETIRKTAEAQGRHKKQTGGSGQFGDVKIRFEPQYETDDVVFCEEVFGGSVPKNFFPAVEKGIRDAATKGVLAGYPLVGLKATLFDGSYHPVDSNEMAFRTAAQLAYKEGIANANPTILEPIGALKVTIPDNYLGDVMGDLNKRRGRVMGMNPTNDGDQILEAEVPMAEMTSYAIDLRSLTQSRGSFTFEFVRYEEAPPAARDKAIEDAKAMEEA
jgi:elongation factor G